MENRQEHKMKIWPIQNLYYRALITIKYGHWEHFNNQAKSKTKGNQIRLHLSTQSTTMILDKS